MEIKYLSYKIAHVEEPIYVTEEELNKLIDSGISGYLAKTRDLFVFCALTGMRYSDSQRFDQRSIINRGVVSQIYCSIYDWDNEITRKRFISFMTKFFCCIIQAVI